MQEQSEIQAPALGGDFREGSCMYRDEQEVPEAQLNILNLWN